MRAKILALVVFVFSLATFHAEAQGTNTFTYQGQLQSNGVAINGTYDFTFALSNAATAGAALGPVLTNSAVVVSNGLFHTTLDFGPVFDGTPAWLNIAVRSNGLGNFVALSPPQQLLAVPYAQFASNAAVAATFTGPISASQLPPIVLTNNASVITISNLSMDGIVNISTLNYADPFLIQYDSDPLIYADLDENFSAGVDASSGAAALDATGYYNIQQNTAIGEGSLHGSIGSYNTAVGANTLNYNLDGGNNTAIGTQALVYNADGSRNTAVGSGALVYLGSGTLEPGGSRGGTNDIAVGFQAGLYYTNDESYNIDIGNGGVPFENYTIHLGTPGTHTNTFIAGVINGNGFGLTNLSASNLVNGVVPTSVLPGFQLASNYATIGGGVNNSATNTGATVPGGSNNIAGGLFSFAAGLSAQATSNYSFVWSDGSATTSSYSNNSVTFRATNGLRFYTGTNGAILFTNFNHTGSDQAVSWSPGGASWTFTSDRETKDRFDPVDPRDVLEKVARLPVSEWSYKGYPQRHIGAMAQDFHSLFPLNDNDKSLNDADLHGVELAAIKGLNEKLQTEMSAKDAEIAALQKQLQELRDTVNQMAAHK